MRSEEAEERARTTGHSDANKFISERITEMIFKELACVSLSYQLLDKS